MASANTIVWANAWVEASAMMVSAPPMKKRDQRAAEQLPETADRQTKKKRQVDVADVRIDAQHRADQRAREPGDQRPARKHELVGAGDVEPEQARHFLVLQQRADLDAERRAIEDESGGADQRERESGHRRPIGRHVDRSGQGERQRVGDVRKSVPKAILMTSVAIRKSPR